MIRREKAPPSWKWVPLGQICQIIGGKPAPQTESAFHSAGIPFVRMKDLGAYHLTTNLVNVTDRISAEYLRENNISPVRKGAILLPRSGSVALNHRAILGVDAVIVSHICALEVLSSDVFNVYLYYVLTQTSMQTITKKTTGLDAITFEDLSKVEIPLPPLPEQRRIAAILDKADAIRRKRQESIRLTEEFLRSVFLDMFGDIAMNPKGWDKTPIKELGMVMTGNTPSREKPEYYGDDIEWIKSDNINTPYHFLTEAKEKLSSEGKRVGRVVSDNSVLVTCIAGSPECIGNAALTDKPVAFNQQINAVTPFEGVDPYFLYVQLLVAKKLIQQQSTESMKGMVSKGKFENILLLNPPYPLQEKYGKLFIKCQETFCKNINALTESDNLYGSIIQRAFRGEL